MTERPTPRPYLRAEGRRRQLLEGALRVFSRSGYAGLTMVAVASEAGVSRRLVYDHFPDLPALHRALFDDVLDRYLASFDLAVATGAGKPGESFRGAFDHLLAMGSDDRRVITLLVLDTTTPELEPLRALFREHVDRRWLPSVTGAGADTAVARSLLWVTVSAMFQLVELVDRGDATAAEARALASAITERVPEIAATATPRTTTMASPSPVSISTEAGP